MAGVPLQKYTLIVRKVAPLATFVFLLATCIGCASQTRVSRSISIEPMLRAGPVRGYIARIDLLDPRVQICVQPATRDDPDGDGPSVTRLDEVKSIAARNRLDLAVNASFFAAPASRVVMGKDNHYFKGNPAWPLGWLVSDARVIAIPRQHPAPSLVVFGDRVEIDSDLIDLPPDVRQVVSGSEMLVDDGEIVARDIPAIHPRTAVGLNADASELILVVIDGRRENWSRGVTLRELAEIMREHGAYDALNLDGGGSTTLVHRVSGGHYRILNRPSDGTERNTSLSIPRAVCDVVGVRILP